MDKFLGNPTKEIMIKVNGLILKKESISTKFCDKKTYKKIIAETL